MEVGGCLVGAAAWHPPGFTEDGPPADGWLATAATAATVIVPLCAGAWAFYMFWRQRTQERDAVKADSTVRAYAARDPADPWLHEALRLYQDERRIPRDEKAPNIDMVRWVREERDKSWFARLYCRDDLIVGVCQGAATGLLHLTHYVWSRIAFVSYVVARRPGTNAPSTHALIDCMGRLLRSRLPRCQTLVAEVDDPRLAPTKRERSTRRARLHLFADMANAQGSHLAVLDAPYLQPRLDPDSQDAEIPMLLLVFWTHRTRPISVSRRHARKILRVVYERVYGDSFLNNPEDSRRYRMYLNGLTSRVASALPRRVRLLGAAALASEGTIPPRGEDLA